MTREDILEELVLGIWKRDNDPEHLEHLEQLARYLADPEFEEDWDCSEEE
ncbi:MAG: hypothetical protein AB1486_18625 [Planctomycetota bacterium]